MYAYHLISSYQSKSRILHDPPESVGSELLFSLETSFALIMKTSS